MFNWLAASKGGDELAIEFVRDDTKWQHEWTKNKTSEQRVLIEDVIGSCEHNKKNRNWIRM